MDAPPSGTFWIPIDDGAILAGPHPVLAPEGLEARVAVLINEVGVTHFLDLSASEDWMPAYRELLGPQQKYVRYEIRDRWLPPDAERLRAILRIVIADTRAGRVTYMHCQAGLGRTGTVIGVLLRELGRSGEQALEELWQLRFVAGLHEGSPEFEQQRQYVRDWTVRSE